MYFPRLEIMIMPAGEVLAKAGLSSITTIELLLCHSHVRLVILVNKMQQSFDAFLSSTFSI
jgi:hypothetical protein